MTQALTEAVKTIRIENAAVAGTTDVVGDTIDMQGFDSIRCIALLGTLTTTHVTTLKAASGDLANGSDAVQITGAVTAAAADGDSNHLLILDVVKPVHRYVTFTLDRGTANAVLDGMIVEQYNASDMPTAIDGTVTAQKIIAAVD